MGNTSYKQGRAVVPKLCPLLCIIAKTGILVNVCSAFPLTRERRSSTITIMIKLMPSYHTRTAARA
jgi:hypothetical protein